MWSTKLNWTTEWIKEIQESDNMYSPEQKQELIEYMKQRTRNAIGVTWSASADLAQELFTKLISGYSYTDWRKKKENIIDSAVLGATGGAVVGATSGGGLFSWLTAPVGAIIGGVGGAIIGAFVPSKSAEYETAKSTITTFVDNVHNMWSTKLNWTTEWIKEIAESDDMYSPEQKQELIDYMKQRTRNAIGLSWINSADLAQELFTKLISGYSYTDWSEKKKNIIDYAITGATGGAVVGAASGGGLFSWLTAPVGAIIGGVGGAIIGAFKPEKSEIYDTAKSTINKLVDNVHIMWTDKLSASIKWLKELQKDEIFSSEQKEELKEYMRSSSRNAITASWINAIDITRSRFSEFISDGISKFKKSDFDTTHTETQTKTIGKRGSKVTKDISVEVKDGNIIDNMIGAVKRIWDKSITGLTNRIETTIEGPDENFDINPFVDVVMNAVSTGLKDAWEKANEVLKVDITNSTPYGFGKSDAIDSGDIRGKNVRADDPLYGLKQVLLIPAKLVTAFSSAFAFAGDKIMEESDKAWKFDVMEKSIKSYLNTKIDNLPTKNYWSTKETDPTKKSMFYLARAFQSPFVFIKNVVKELQNWMKDQGSWIEDVVASNIKISYTGSGSGRGSGRGGNESNYQINPRVSNKRFNNPNDTIKQTIGDSGCAPAAAAMYMNNMYTTEQMADLAIEGGYKDINSGVRPEFFRAAFASAGMDTSYIDPKSTKSMLNNGMSVVLLGKNTTNNKTRSPFTTSGHYVIARGLKGNNILIEDPENMKGIQSYNASDILKQASVGIVGDKVGDKAKANNSYIFPAGLGSFTELEEKIIDKTIELTSGNEGGYTSVNPADNNGPYSVGKFQFHASTAKEMFTRLANVLPNKQDADTARMYANWSSRALTSAEATGMKNFLAKSSVDSYSKTVQDQYARELTAGRNLAAPFRMFRSGVLKDPRSLILAGDIGNTGPAHLDGWEKAYKPVTDVSKELAHVRDSLKSSDSWWGRATGEKFYKAWLDRIDRTYNHLASWSIDGYTPSSSSSSSSTVAANDNTLGGMFSRLGQAFASDTNKLLTKLVGEDFINLLGGPSKTNTSTSETSTQDSMNVEVPGGANAADSFFLKNLPGSAVSSTFNKLRTFEGKTSRHRGIDYSAPGGTPIPSATDGTVTTVSYESGGAGHYCIIQDRNGYYHYYMHMNKKPCVAVGNTVKMGDILGYVGTTGHSTGNHLHYEIRNAPSLSGTSQNPNTYLADFYKTGTGSKNFVTVGAVVKPPKEEQNYQEGKGGKGGPKEDNSLLNTIIEVLLKMLDNTSKLDRLEEIVALLGKALGVEDTETKKSGSAAKSTSKKQEISNMLSKLNKDNSSGSNEQLLNALQLLARQ